MSRRSLSFGFFILVLVFAGTTLACSFTVNLPSLPSLPAVDVKTGPIREESIEVPAPSAESAQVTINFGAGNLNLAPGAENALIQGTATYNVEDLKPVIETNSNRVRLSTGELKIRGIPSFDNNLKNVWELKLGDLPMNLSINAGAYQGRFELGGVPLQTLDVTDGASNVELSFSEPNPVEMSSLRYETGASDVTLTGLGNANFDNMIFRSGAGDYLLDFTGTLQRDAEAEVRSGISQVSLAVPEEMNVVVIFSGGLTNIDTTGNWQKSGDEEYTHQGSGPTLTIRVEMGAGSLRLSSQ